MVVRVAVYRVALLGHIIQERADLVLVHAQARLKPSGEGQPVLRRRQLRVEPPTALVQGHSKLTLDALGAPKAKVVIVQKSADLHWLGFAGREPPVAVLASELGGRLLGWLGVPE
jgi:hypothetical protein